jgi:anthranilate phosphoribosyltransferase
VRAVLAAERKDEARQLVLMTAAAALLLGGVVGSLREGAVRAAEAIDSGAAIAKLERLVQATN